MYIKKNPIKYNTGCKGVEVPGSGFSKTLMPNLMPAYPHFMLGLILGRGGREGFRRKFTGGKRRVSAVEGERARPLILHTFCNIMSVMPYGRRACKTP
jgi:hypothetical protein